MGHRATVPFYNLCWTAVLLMDRCREVFSSILLKRFTYLKVVHLPAVLFQSTLNFLLILSTTHHSCPPPELHPVSSLKTHLPYVSTGAGEIPAIPLKMLEICHFWGCLRLHGRKPDFKAFICSNDWIYLQ